jgi:hypothetical protein
MKPTTPGFVMCFPTMTNFASCGRYGSLLLTSLYEAWEGLLQDPKSCQTICIIADEEQYNNFLSYE